MDIKKFLGRVDIRGIVGAVAPTLATALGGPLAGMATRAIAQAVLGRDDASEKDLAQAISSAGPEQLAALRRADQEFTLRMRELDIDVERIAAGDRDSARAREIGTGDRATPRVLAFVIVAGFLGMVGGVLAGKVTGISDPTAAGMIGTLIGYVSAKADQVVAYYFGSSAGSARKTDLLERIDAAGKRAS
jgi:hypothetical protein